MQKKRIQKRWTVFMSGETYRCSVLTKREDFDRLVRNSFLTDNVRRNFQQFFRDYKQTK